MKNLSVFLGVAVAALTLASCNKELEQKPTPTNSSAASTLAKPDLLTSGSWHQTGLTVSAPGEGTAAAATSDLFARSKPSMLITLAAYKADGTFSLMRGARSGGPLPEPVSGKWQLNAAADSLIITEATRTRRLAVTELTASTLRLSYTQKATEGKASTYTSVFSH